MAQLWGGRFTKETDQLVYQFNASISFDKRFYAQDIRGSIAHVMMLARQGILTDAEKEKIVEGLEGILGDVENGRLEITDQYEDIHSFVEATLIDRIGEPGKKLHTGRSRNDQVALDMKLYARDEVHMLNQLVKELLQAVLAVMEEHVDTYMPGFTHLQKAQPVTLAHHMGAEIMSGFRIFTGGWIPARWGPALWREPLIRWIGIIRRVCLGLADPQETAWMECPTGIIFWNFCRPCRL